VDGVGLLGMTVTKGFFSATGELSIPPAAVGESAVLTGGFLNLRLRVLVDPKHIVGSLVGEKIAGIFVILKVRFVPGEV